MWENATGGLGNRKSNRGFGVELEVDILGSQARKERNIANIIGELAEYGLIQQNSPYSHGYTGTRGYSRNFWSVEYDSSVTIEIISPILYDEKVTWEELDLVCSIIEANNGIATRRTGGHVHVGFGEGLETYKERVLGYKTLLNVTECYEDELFRLATNPYSLDGKHRGLGYCIPNRRICPDYYNYKSIWEFTPIQHAVINFWNAKGRSKKDHIEFRLWDGSLDPAVIQTHIKLSLAIAAYATRAVRMRQEVPNFSVYNPLGTAIKEDKRLYEASYGFRKLLDTIFYRESDKAQATALFAINNWQENQRIPRWHWDRALYLHDAWYNYLCGY